MSGALAANPDRRRDYVVTLARTVDLEGQPVRVVVAYVPDRVVMPPAAFADALAELAASGADGMEAAGTRLVWALGNALVPRWMRVVLSTRVGDVDQRVVLEERQPQWDNAALLAALNETR